MVNYGSLILDEVENAKLFSDCLHKKGLGLVMDDEFLVYLKRKIGERLIISFDNTDLLLWGVRDSGIVRLLGLTLAIGIDNLAAGTSKLNQLAFKINNIANIALSLSQRSKSAFFIVLYSLSGSSVFRVTSPNDPLNLPNSTEVEENDMPMIIESFFGTALGSPGTKKPVNKSTSDWFHVWTRENLPTIYVKANIDGLILTKEGKPAILLETKRSFYETSNWEPYKDDSRNYYLQSSIAKKAGLNFWTIYHKKGIQVTDSSEVALFIISEIQLDKPNWISHERFNIAAVEVVKKLDDTCRDLK